jgi:hypothetical protein
LAVAFLAGAFFFEDFLAVAFFLAAMWFTSSPSSSVASDVAHRGKAPFRGSCSVVRAVYEAMRLSRRRSRSLMPPHTPYRSSRRRA